MSAREQAEATLKRWEANWSPTPFHSRPAVERDFASALRALLAETSPQTFVDEVTPEGYPTSTPADELRTGDIVRLTGRSWDEWKRSAAGGTLRGEEVEIEVAMWGPGFDHPTGSFAIWDPTPADKIIGQDYSVTRIAEGDSE